MGSHAHPTQSVESAADKSDVEIPAEMQTVIREFARSLPEKTYYEVLGVPADADEGAIRDAFFESSKRFHPDRYFRKKLGPYLELLTEIYKRVVLSYEVLRDAKLRSEYDKSREAAAKPAAKREGPSLRARGGVRFGTSALQRLELQIQRGRQQARAKLEEALAQRDQGDWVRAVSLVRLAMAFDPREPAYHEVLAELLPRANADQATLLRSRAEELMKRGQTKDALPFLEEAFKLQPTDAEAAFQIADLVLELTKDLEKAREFVEHATALDERNTHYRKTLGRLYKNAGLMDRAREEFRRAWELDPLDKEVRAELTGR
jgi:tetratricopeptide (TPR) repeat protein